MATRMSHLEFSFFSQHSTHHLPISKSNSLCKLSLSLPSSLFGDIFDNLYNSSNITSSTIVPILFLSFLHSKLLLYSSYIHLYMCDLG